MGQTCNCVAAAMFRVEAAVRHGLTNTACTSKANEWLPCRNEVKPARICDLNFSPEKFAERGKTKRPLVSSPQKKYRPIKK